MMLDCAMVTRGRSNIDSYVLPDYSGSALSTGKSRRGNHDSEDSSERTILPNGVASYTQNLQGKIGEIMRTTRVSLTMDETEPQSQSRNVDWA